MKKELIIGLVVLGIVIVVFVVISLPGNQSDKVIQQLICDPGFVGAWQLMKNPVYFIVESDCKISKFCDLNEDIHTTGYIDENKITLYGVANNEIILEGNNTLIMLGGSGGIDLPFTRVEGGTETIPENC